MTDPIHEHSCRECGEPIRQPGLCDKCKGGVKANDNFGTSLPGEQQMRMEAEQARASIGNVANPEDIKRDWFSVLDAWRDMEDKPGEGFWR